MVKIYQNNRAHKIPCQQVPTLNMGYQEGITIGSSVYQEFLRQYESISYSFQNNAGIFLDNHKISTFSIPTGAGKSRIIYTDILKNIVSSKIFTIASHRLMLNSQHLKSMLTQFELLTGNIGYIFVGSDGFKLKVKNKTRIRLNNLLKNKGLNYKDIISSTTSEKEIIEIIKNHAQNNRKVVIISTYHSLNKLKNINIDTIYCDEAHILATQDLFTKFKESFLNLTFNKSCFFTATVKDSGDEETNAFLMNNKGIFGERFELGFKEAIDLGLIVRPTIHNAIPSNYDKSKKFGSIKNYCRFIKEVVIAHRKWVKEISFNPDLIAFKLLIKAPAVDAMWKIFNKLKNDKELSGIKIFAGASRSDIGAKHKFDDNDVDNRYDYLKKIQKLKDTEEAIILHYDIFSEGIDVPGLTGVMFLSDTLPTKPKILQNIGRGTRIYDLDRYLLRNNQISTDDYTKWIKPSCAVILPIISVDGEYAVNQISELIKELRDRYGFDASFIVSEGCDLAKTKNDDGLPNLNKPDRKDASDIIKRINQEIERLDGYDEMSVFSNKFNICEDDDELDKLLEEELYN